MLFTITNNSATNPQTLDLTNEVSVVHGQGLDPAAATYSDKQFTHSLLKEGGVYTLESPQMKEVIFPILVGAGLNLTSSQAAARVQQINQIINTPGATAQWQDDGMSQATYYPLTTGILDVEYDFREQSGAHFIRGKLRLFSLPYVTPAAPRVFAAASGIGPLLMISPYASSGALAVAASTQAGVAGFGGKPNGASTGIFYGGNPSLAGDAPALLQISYVAPLPAGATPPGTIPYMAVSWLPDQNYTPLITASQLAITSLGNTTYARQTTAVASTYILLQNGINGPNERYTFTPGLGDIPPAAWAGNHRLFAIARASNAHAGLQSFPNTMVPFSTSATINPGDWQLADLGVIQFRASEPPGLVMLGVNIDNTATTTCAFDLTALVMLPDSTTWYFNPAEINPSQYGFAQYMSGFNSFPSGYYTNTLFVDDTIPGQYLYAGASQRFAPSVSGMGASTMRISPFTRGIIPRPDPSRGLPILAILGVGQTFAAIAQSGPAVASWNNAQNLPSYAQVSIVERARYILS